MPAKQMPVLVKHCALAIYRSGYCTGTKVQKVVQALDIAVSRLIEYKFLWKTAGKVAPEKIKLTAKGLKAESRHRREKGGIVKTRAWNELYNLIQEEIEEDDGDGATSQEVGMDLGDPRSARSLNKRRRLARAARHGPKRRRPKRARKVRSARRR
jgi:hypothetical protein